MEVERRGGGRKGKLVGMVVVVVCLGMRCCDRGCDVGVKMMWKEEEGPWGLNREGHGEENWRGGEEGKVGKVEQWI